MANEHYPDNQMQYAPEIPEEWREFANRREALLINYSYNTARAYWADLQDWFEWAIEHKKDILNLTDVDKTSYVSILRRRGYSEATVKRRIVTIGLFERTQLAD